jgi:hypothetical protein
MRSQRRGGPGVPSALAPGLDRRTFFLASLSLAGGALLEGWPASAGASAVTTAARSGTGRCELGHVDDMWGHCPRYAHPIPHGGSQPELLAWERMAPADRMWAAWA